MMTLRWLGISIVVVILFFGLLWLSALSKSQAREIASQLQAQQPKTPMEPEQEYVLEVIGLGVTLDKYRYHHLRRQVVGWRRQLPDLLTACPPGISW